MNTWFLAKVKCMREDEKGSIRKFTDQYLIDAMSFTEAEARAHEEIRGFVKGEFEIAGLSKSNVTEVFEYSKDELWFKAKVTYQVEDADSGRQKKYNLYMMVSANDLKEAYERLSDNLAGMLNSPKVVQLQETQILEIFWHQAAEEPQLSSEEDDL
jgi:hypothetical protein